MSSSPSLCPSGENAGVGRPDGEEDGSGDESRRRRRDGRDLDLAFAGARVVDGADDGSAIDFGDCTSVSIVAVRGPEKTKKTKPLKPSPAVLRFVVSQDTTGSQQSGSTVIQSFVPEFKGVQGEFNGAAQSSATWV